MLRAAVLANHKEAINKLRSCPTAELLSPAALEWLLVTALTVRMGDSCDMLEGEGPLTLAQALLAYPGKLLMVPVQFCLPVCFLLVVTPFTLYAHY